MVSPLCRSRANAFSLLTDLICLLSRPGTSVPCLIISYMICRKGRRSVRFQFIRFVSKSCKNIPPKLTSLGVHLNNPPQASIAAKNASCSSGFQEKWADLLGLVSITLFF